MPSEAKMLDSGESSYSVRKFLNFEVDIYDECHKYYDACHTNCDW